MGTGPSGGRYLYYGEHGGDLLQSLNTGVKQVFVFAVCIGHGA